MEAGRTKEQTLCEKQSRRVQPGQMIYGVNDPAFTGHIPFKNHNSKNSQVPQSSLHLYLP